MNKNNPPAFENAECASLDVNLFFSKDPDEPGYTTSSSEYKDAKAICMNCPERVECGDWGIKNEIHGMWGGFTPRERQKLRKLRGIKIPLELITKR